MSRRISLQLFSVPRAALIRSYSNGAPEKFPVIKYPMLPSGSFKGRSAFVTGGGTGLGRGITELLSSLGATVVISSRCVSNLNKTACRLCM